MEWIGGADSRILAERFWGGFETAPHRYEIKCLNPFEAILRNMSSPLTTFTTLDPRLPLPDPALLALHATCAKVASGAGEHIDRVHKDIRHLDVLAEDGGSSDVLFHALYHSSTVDVGT
ncbi:MAG: hypothetical protein NXY57DRAFT_964607 [Lentinula lateritia]|nr:MAG: hypothetical protein NXY57DRAFT_964607 [Lentinula lateritia]